MSVRLVPGDMAPHFQVQDMEGRPIRLGDYGGRWLLLSFYRYASCPLCNLRIHTLSQQRAAWQAQGMDMLAVFQSPQEKMLQYVGRQQAPFPLIPDAGQRLYALYGVKCSVIGFLKAWMTRLPEITRSVLRLGYFPGSVEGGIHRIPADFVINPQGRITEAYYGRDIGDHLPVERVAQWLRLSMLDMKETENRDEPGS